MKEPTSSLTCFCGPCVIEGADPLFEAAEQLATLFEGSGASLIFKSSYDKANRSSITSYRGPGLDEGLALLRGVKERFGLRVTTDVHSPEEARAAADVCDIIQIPAFLCRQTDLLVAAAKTPATVNVKKGQFLAPWDMRHVVAKLEEGGKRDIILTERGATFGYNNLVADMRAIPIMQQLGYPVCFDATHSIQLPGAAGTASGGTAEFIPHLAKAALAAGADLLFIEAHPSPEKALCDSASQLSFKRLAELLPALVRLKRAL
jgi:2-dehydro-3-deoxyphosphooctonate aldolase (KDO 8-P synthase)